MILRRSRFAAPATWLSLLFAPALSLAPAGCATKPRPVAAEAKSSAPAAASPAPVRAPQGPAPTLLPPALRPVGRLVAVDEKAGTAIVELSRFAALPDTLVAVTLFARDREMRPVARLEGTPYQQGLILGVRITDGRAAVGDEVVLPAPAAPTPPPPPDAFPALQPAPVK
jgi:hypothetical protein